MYLNNSKKIVIKIGSSLLIDKSKKVRVKWLSEFSKDIKQLLEQNKKIIIVSSGAIAIGCKKLNINKKNFPSLKKELESILELVAKMDSVNTDSVVPMSHPLDISQPLRKDEVTEKDDRKNLQKNAPLEKAGLFMVPKVIDEDA